MIPRNAGTREGLSARRVTLQHMDCVRRTGRQNLDRSCAGFEPGRGARFNQNTNTETGNNPQPQLYNLGDDLGETRNLAEQNPEKVKELAASLNKLRDTGRSRP